MITGRHKLAGLHTSFRPAVELLLDIAEDAKVNVVVTSATRTVDEQRHLCAQLRERAARTGEKLPCATPGLSAHNWGLAVDLVAGVSVHSAEHAWLRRVGSALGFAFVSDDPPHFEHPQWRAILPLVRERLRT